MQIDIEVPLADQTVEMKEVEVGAQACLHATKERAEGTVTVVQATGRQPQRGRGPIGAGAQLAGEHLTAGDLVVGT